MHIVEVRRSNAELAAAMAGTLGYEVPDLIACSLRGAVALVPRHARHVYPIGMLNRRHRPRHQQPGAEGRRSGPIGIAKHFRFSQEPQ